MKHVIAIGTRRHSEFLRRLLDRYAHSCRIEIDGKQFGPVDVEELKAVWCMNGKIRSARDFQIDDGSRFVASFHDGVDELFVSEEERNWIHALSEEKLLRYRLLPSAY